MTRSAIQFSAVVLTFGLLLAAALGYFAPAAMLSVVGIAASPVAEFLARTIAAAFLAMLPIVWAVRHRGSAPAQTVILLSLSLYMFAGSAVDLHAYFSAIVGFAAIPSVVFRTILGAVLAWLAMSRD
ncbi:hypothetical protein GCM10010869_22330 [Mesorhizobium tianshanense]|uniref:Uncharacterized protein n=1 Tax=Mesorhizobium tianshanense TaxID=39844 RepID=A0A562P2K1_9HYPH|nr:hypothetical protein [Mesorhizobium tianshanense]TWI38708.1 hypothetical protein IQ26_02129 [Mesorhizobium tianshanense]GLS36642.1 hypothetical protein GCM10010869_22330 [Mesorhizobium tianshanense]